MIRWRTPELDESAADAVALVALYVAGAAEDASMASQLLDEMTAAPDGVSRTVGGLISLCSTLLALQEFDGGIAPEIGLRRAALAIQAARADAHPRPLSS
jgi:hypothetical protein